MVAFGGSHTALQRFGLKDAPVRALLDVRGAPVRERVLSGQALASEAPAAPVEAVARV